jgi:hypothetical protein
MTTVGIIPGLNEVEDGHPRLGMISETTPVQQLVFERGEETLSERVVVAIAHGTHRRPHAGALAPEGNGDSPGCLGVTLRSVFFWGGLLAYLSKVDQENRLGLAPIVWYDDWRCHHYRPGFHTENTRPRSFAGMAAAVT